MAKTTERSLLLSRLPSFTFEFNFSIIFSCAPFGPMRTAAYFLGECNRRLCAIAPRRLRLLSTSTDFESAENEYKKFFKQSLENPENFWGCQAEAIHWFPLPPYPLFVQYHSYLFNYLFKFFGLGSLSRRECSTTTNRHSLSPPFFLPHCLTVYL